MASSKSRSKIERCLGSVCLIATAHQPVMRRDKEASLMKCVLLLGFSTTGKSTILREFREKYSNAIDTIDSDKEISSEDDGHIYNVFLRFVDRNNTNPAIQEIERRERRFLESVRLSRTSLLLAAGPFLPIREPEWSAFLERVRPVCFYLQKPPEEVLQGLIERRVRHLQNEQLASQYGFGCWDQGVTTEYREGHWVQIDDKERALQNVRDNMREMVRRYERLAARTFCWQDRQTKEGQQRLYRAIREELGL